MAEDDFIDLGRVDTGLFSRARITVAPSSTAGTLASEPWKLPMAVRVAATMTTSCMTDSE